MNSWILSIIRDHSYNNSEKNFYEDLFNHEFKYFRTAHYGKFGVSRVYRCQKCFQTFFFNKTDLVHIRDIGPIAFAIINCDETAMELALR